MGDEESQEAGWGIGTGFARILYGLAGLFNGAPGAAPEGLQAVAQQVQLLAERLETIEDRFQSYRLEIQRMTAEMEATLDDATKRYAKARASESRANREDNTDGAPGGLPDIARDPEAYRAWLARGRQ